jgi:hypothetical protein
MLLSSNRIEWECAYSCAKELLATQPKQMSTLDAIYGNPEKYGGYYLHSLDGNLQMHAVMCWQNRIIFNTSMDSGLSHLILGLHSKLMMLKQKKLVWIWIFHSLDKNHQKLVEDPA